MVLDNKLTINIYAGLQKAFTKRLRQAIPNVRYKYNKFTGYLTVDSTDIYLLYKIAQEFSITRGIYFTKRGA